MPVRVLCLHGAQQTREIFEHQLSRFRDDLEGVAELIFVEAPYVLPLITADDDAPTRLWCTPDDREDYSAGDAIVAAAMQPGGRRTDLACTVMLGFSQGSLMIYRYLRTHATDSAVASQLRGVVVAGAPDPRRAFPCNTRSNLFSSLDEAAPVFGGLPFLHIVGKKDGIVPPAESMAFAQVCSTASRLLVHEHAHSIPALKEVRLAVREVCQAASMSSAEVAEAREARAEELDMVRSMYEEECVASRANEAVVRIPLITDAASLLASSSSPAAASLEPAAVHALERVKICFRVPWSYPTTLPTVELTDGPAWHSVAYERWAADVVVRTSSYLADELGPGTAMLLPAYLYAAGLVEQEVDVLIDVLAQGPGGATGRGGREEAEAEAAGGGSAAQQASVWAAEDEALREKLIAEAEAKAAAMLQAEARRSGDGRRPVAEMDSDEEAEEAADAEAAAAAAAAASAGEAAASSGGGSCALTIGLIGKPSAGKSTFFNAVTNPDDESEAARVAAFPFTTIEPNIGAALAPLYCPCVTLLGAEGASSVLSCDLGESGCDAAYGHVCALGCDRFRRHPVKVKDVAGLVQGAYEGKGKGNQFLNDLCDADVLVHVVDGAAATEADGTACTPGQGSAMEDITWVRAEVHSWIYDNLRAKWSSIVRQPAKLRTMFSGYRSTPLFVDRVLRRVGIANEVALNAKLRTWGPAELHAFVALYIRLRFPMVVALNKADLATASDVAASLRQAYPHEVFVPMSARTECLALHLHRRGLVAYTPGASVLDVKVSAVDAAKFEKGVRQDLGEVATFFRAAATAAASAAGSPSSRAHLATTGVQDVLATAMEACGVVLVYPVRAFQPVTSLAQCLTFKLGSSAERVFNALVHLRLLEGKLVRFEVVDLASAKQQHLQCLLASASGAPTGDAAPAATQPGVVLPASVRTVRKTEVIHAPVVLARVLSNKRQLA